VSLKGKIFYHNTDYYLSNALPYFRSEIILNFKKFKFFGEALNENMRYQPPIKFVDYRIS